MYNNVYLIRNFQFHELLLSTIWAYLLVVLVSQAFRWSFWRVHKCRLMVPHIWINFTLFLFFINFTMSLWLYYCHLVQVIRFVIVLLAQDWSTCKNMSCYLPLVKSITGSFKHRIALEKYRQCVVYEIFVWGNYSKN